jgi:hypothetical protein
LTRPVTGDEFLAVGSHTYCGEFGSEYTTALSVLTLSTPYQLLPIHQTEVRLVNMKSLLPRSGATGFASAH